MSITLTPQLEKLVQDRVKSGAFRSSDEVLEVALRMLDERERKREALCADLQVGLDQAERGEVAPLDMKALIERFSAKHAEKSPA